MLSHLAQRSRTSVNVPYWHQKCGFPPAPLIEISFEKNTNLRVPVRIIPYDQRWPYIALAEMDLFCSAFTNHVLRIEHIGSTSVPGKAAKPIVDLMPVVADLEALNLEIARLGQLGYSIHGACGIPCRRFCTKTNLNGERTFHLHSFPETSQHVIRHLAFRDYMRAHLHESMNTRSFGQQSCIPKTPLTIAQLSLDEAHEQRVLKWVAGKSADL